mmetsp:Transcript_36857/g.77810  ORF Transcript_36857/g.77810 Transcript_36857/m.77810 type:complete len:111 (+) Transcript_36857:907-1239(+)
MGMPSDREIVGMRGLALGLGGLEVIAHEEGVGKFAGDGVWEGLADRAGITEGMGDALFGNSIDFHERGCHDRFCCVHEFFLCAGNYSTDVMTIILRTTKTSASNDLFSYL